MTGVEQLALDVQTSVLVRLEQQLAAVERAIVRVEAAVAEAVGEGTLESSIHEPSEHARHGADDDEGWTTVFEARELSESHPDSGSGRSPPESVREPADRWSAPMQPRRREPMPRVDAATKVPASGPMRANQSRAAAKSEAISQPRGASPSDVAGSLAGEHGRESSHFELGPQGHASASESSETLRSTRGQPQADRWSRPMRPSGPGRRDPSPIDPPAIEHSNPAAAVLAPSSKPKSPRQRPIDPGTRPVIEPSEPLQLPAPLRLADDPGFDPGRSLALEPEPWMRERPRELVRPSQLARPSIPAREHVEPTRSRIPELSLDDEFDQLSRLEEQMADVLERVLLEIGVEP